MKKIKVTMLEWTCKEVEYICNVDENDKEDGDEWDDYGIGYLDGSDLGTDAMGFDAIPISKKLIDDKYDFRYEVDSWNEVK